MIDLAAKRGAGVVLHAFLDGRTAPRKRRRLPPGAQVKLPATGAGTDRLTHRPLFRHGPQPRWAAPRKPMIDRPRPRPLSIHGPIHRPRHGLRAGETDEFVQADGHRDHAATAGARGRWRCRGVHELPRRPRAPAHPGPSSNPISTASSADGRAALGAFVSLTRYHADFHIPFAYPPERLHNVLANTSPTEGSRNCVSRRRKNTPT